MIEFYSETNFELSDQVRISAWLGNVILEEGKSEGDITYVFCDDAYLHNINLEFLQHDTLTDIISFDYSLGNQVHGEIYISIERVIENASNFNTTFENELHRVMVHGILHYCGYKDKLEVEASLMRDKENRALELLSTL